MAALAGLAGVLALSADAPAFADAGIAEEAGAGGASITVRLRDRAGVGVAGALVTIESLGVDGERRYMEVKTDAAGRARVLEVPAAMIERVQAGYADGEGLTVISDQVPVPEGRETVIDLVVPEPTESPAGLSIDALHVVLERRGGRVRVTSAVTVRAAPGTAYRGAPIRLPLPAGAVAPEAPAREEREPAAAVEGDGFLVAAPIPASGLELELRFELPIEQGRAGFEQRFGLPVDRLRVVSTWTAGDAELQVAGIEPAVISELGSGVAGLVAMGSGPRDGRLAVSLAGLTDGPEVPWRRGTLLSSLALLLLGAGWRLRRRRTAGGEG